MWAPHFAQRVSTSSGSTRTSPRTVMPNQPRWLERRKSYSMKPISANTASGERMRPGQRDSLT